MAKYAVDFDTMDAAVQQYLRQYRHWPATYWADCKNPNSYIIYHILPDAANADNNERLGDIEISKIPGGTLLEFKEGYAQERKPTYDELRVLRHVEKAVASRLRPDNYDGEDEEQFAALRDLVESDLEVIGARIDLEARLLNEVLARYGEFEARMEEVMAGLLDWLAVHGIEEVAKEPDKNHNGASGNQRDSGHYSYSPDDRKRIAEAYRAARAAGEIENIDAWAQSKYAISGRTLRNYCKEFPAET